MRFGLIAISVLLAATAVWAGSLWVLNTSASTETFNGITAPELDFAIAVGENGAIVHFADGDTTGTLVPSGTSSELFDVYASSRNMAVATGEDIVLLWDGVSWNPIVEIMPPQNLVFTGAWISPEEDVVFYGAPGFSFDQVCNFDPGLVDPAICRLFGSPMLTACGSSDDAKLLLASGDIWNLDNGLMDANGTTAEIHDEPGNLFLTGIYIPGDACLPGPFAPVQLFAIQNGQTFMQFDGTSWSSMGVTVPAGQTLTWIGGTGPGNVIAIGFEPDGLGGNQGVIWRYDGTSWAEDMNLPPNTPGLTDVAANLVFDNEIFASGFESGARSQLKMTPGTRVNILAAAEAGRVLSSAELFPNTASDLSVSKTLLTSPPYQIGDRIEFQLTVFNSGPATATNFDFIDIYNDAIELVTDNCGMSPLPDEPVLFSGRFVTVPELTANSAIVCTMEFDITSSISNQIQNSAAVSGVNDVNYENNQADIVNVPVTQ